jgi:hypothetical protein
MGLPQVIVALVALQRLGEVVYARRNARRLLASGGIERGAGHYPLLVGLHAAWLAAIFAFVPPDAPVSPGLTPVVRAGQQALDSGGTMLSIAPADPSLARAAKFGNRSSCSESSVNGTPSIPIKATRGASSPRNRSNRPMGSGTGETLKNLQFRGERRRFL